MVVLRRERSFPIAQVYSLLSGYWGQTLIMSVGLSAERLIFWNIEDGAYVTGGVHGPGYSGSESIEIHIIYPMIVLIKNFICLPRGGENFNEYYVDRIRYKRALKMSMVVGFQSTFLFNIYRRNIYRISYIWHPYYVMLVDYIRVYEEQ